MPPFLFYTQMNNGTNNDRIDRIRGRNLRGNNPHNRRTSFQHPNHLLDSLVSTINRSRKRIANAASDGICIFHSFLSWSVHHQIPQRTSNSLRTIDGTDAQGR